MTPPEDDRPAARNTVRPITTADRNMVAAHFGLNASAMPASHPGGRTPTTITNRRAGAHNPSAMRNYWVLRAQQDIANALACDTVAKRSVCLDAAKVALDNAVIFDKQANQ